MPKKCFGYDALRGGNILLEYDATIQLADDVVEPAGGLPHIAAGFIDLQVNGYDGVDYNSPDTPHEDIARSIRVQIAAGTTRLLPTVITGSREGPRGVGHDFSSQFVGLPFFGKQNEDITSAIGEQHNPGIMPNLCNPACFMCHPYASR